MSESNWLGYVGVVTGGIGAVTGISGAVMGYIGYRHSRSMKALDLRLQLRKDESDFRACVESLPALLDLAKQSRTRVLAATGLGRSGNEQIFLQAWEVDLLSVNALKSKLGGFEGSYSTNPAELESKIIDVHRLGSEANELKTKYLNALAKDDKARDQIRAEVHERVTATLSPPSDARRP
jgi:hypothetical protein